MRYIRKGEEPESLTQYKKESNAYYDGYADKDDIRRNLMEDQGYLCGYCMRRLNDISDVKIEHIVPQSTLKDDEKKALDYRIMVGVCYGNEKKGRRKECLTCDAHRGSKDLYVDPFDENNINIPFPQVVLNYVMKTISIRLNMIPKGILHHRMKR